MTNNITTTGLRAKALDPLLSASQYNGCAKAQLNIMPMTSDENQKSIGRRFQISVSSVSPENLRPVPVGGCR